MFVRPSAWFANLFLTTGCLYLDFGAVGLLIRFHRPRLTQQFLLHFHPWHAKTQLQPVVNENKKHINSFENRRFKRLIKGSLGTTKMRKRRNTLTWKQKHKHKNKNHNNKQTKENGVTLGKEDRPKQKRSTTRITVKTSVQRKTTTTTTIVAVLKSPRINTLKITYYYFM